MEHAQEIWRLLVQEVDEPTLMPETPFVSDLLRRTVIVLQTQ
jgi:hypothetical protein